VRGDREEVFLSRLCDQSRSVESFHKRDGKAIFGGNRDCRPLSLEMKKELLAVAKPHLLSDVRLALRMAYRPIAYYIP
jgi:hypothetical protein